MAGGRVKGGEMQEGTRGGGGGLDMKHPHKRPAKLLSYMENTSRLQGNRTTSEFSTNKNSSDVWRRPRCSLAPVAPCTSVTWNSHTNTEARVRI